MLSLAVYKIIHLLGLLLLFTSLGALIAGTGGGRRMRGATAAHGIALVLVLIGGFGGLARLGVAGGLPLWIWLKLGLWLALGAAPMVIRRLPGAAGLLLWVLPILGAIGAGLALYKP